MEAAGALVSYAGEKESGRRIARLEADRDLGARSPGVDDLPCGHTWSRRCSPREAPRGRGRRR